MAQRSSGIRSLLADPIIYDLLQSIAGGKNIRKKFVDEFVRPVTGDRLLDIGCGTAQLLPLLPVEIEYVGYDPSFEYIARAQRRFAGRGQFIHGLYDETAASIHSPFDLAIASGVLHHLDDKQVTTLCELVSSSLKPGGRFVTLDAVFYPDQPALARFLASRDRGLNVRFEEEYMALATPSFAEVKGTLKCRSWYTHWIMECVA